MQNVDQTEKTLIREIKSKLLKLNEITKDVFSKYDDPVKMNHRDYVYFVYVSNILYTTKDLIFLCKKLNISHNIFDRSLNILSRAIMEDFCYLLYLLSEKDLVSIKLEALTCYSCQENIKHFKSLLRLRDKKKIFFLEEVGKGVSKTMLENKIKEFEQYIGTHLEFNRSTEYFKNEIERFKNLENICIKYDDLKGLKGVEKDNEAESLEWLYNMIYRYQSGSVHQNLYDKEKVFELYLGNRSKPNNNHILGLVLDILNKVISLNNF